MRARHHAFRRTFAAFVLALVALPAGRGLARAADAPCGGVAPPSVGITYLCQGWDADKAEWWYHVSQGTAIMPYPWFMALNQPTGAGPFAAPDHLARFGFLADPNPNNNDGLPVGFAKRGLEFAAAEPFKYYKGEWIGLACSACHTGQIRYNGTQFRIEGGVAHLDLEGFGKELATAIVKLKDPDEGKAFFQRVVVATGTPQAEWPALRQSIQDFSKVFLGRALLLATAQAQLPDDPVPGLGRLDAVQRGGNLIMATPLDQPKNYASNTAPVRYPALWDTPYFDWVLYDASIRQPLARHVVEALGVGAPFDPATLLSGNIVHGVLLENVVEVHRALKKLESPRWPEYMLPPINSHKLVRGEALYRQNCASCHALITRDTHAPVGATTEDAVRINVKAVPLADIGTDPRQAATLATRVVTLETIPGGPHAIPYTDAVQKVTSGIVEQWAAKAPGNEAAMKEINAGRKNEIRGLFVYRARPLNGIWATAPYLHNGSVPTLHALLLPPGQRPSKFYVGSYEFDPVNVGFESVKPVENGFLFDTTKPGNWNTGHEGHGYGTDLSEEDRMALIEFLKTL